MLDGTNKLNESKAEIEHLKETLEAQVRYAIAIAIGLPFTLFFIDAGNANSAKRAGQILAKKDAEVICFL